MSTSSFPILTNDLARRIERLVAPPLTPFTSSADPRVAVVQQFGQTIASKAKAGKPSNKVFCFGHDDISRLDEILDFYTVDKLMPTFYLSPTDFSYEVGSALTRAGFAQYDFMQGVLYGMPLEQIDPPAPGITIERVTTGTVGEYAETLADGFEWHEDWRENAIDDICKHFKEKDYHFMARYKGAAAGVGSFGVRDGVAGLGGGSVVPSLRNKGCHMALVNHRLYLAHQLNCNMVIGCAFYGSASFRNQQRAGLRLAYIESGWGKI